jgi:ubiquinone/menaquinone biosynthesis C-methylase UbiE
MQVDTQFSGSIPELYNRYLVPLIFEHYAADLTRRLSELRSGTILETAAGTGAVTRELRKGLPPEIEIIATDLNQAMLDRAAAVSPTDGIRWRQADAQALPFEDSCCDAAVCQFGVMFFPDRVKAFREAKRILKPKGRYLFNIWEGLDRNLFAKVVHEAVTACFPSDPPMFLARAPYGQHDRALYKRQLAEAGFAQVLVETVDGVSRAPSAADVAKGFCQGTPLRGEIEARGPNALDEAVESAARALAARLGEGPIEAPMQAFVVTARRD